MEKKRLILPVSIIIGCLILGGFFYLVQVNKQASIETQQRLKIASEKEIEESKLLAQAEIDLAKSELENKKYISEKKNDCVNIYKTEDEKWNNVNGWRYDEENDICYIEYKEKDPKSEEACIEGYPLDGEFGYLNIRGRMNCINGVFEKGF